MEWAQAAGLLAGAGVALLHGIMAFVTVVIARRRGHSSFLTVFFGGMLVRMLCVIVAVTAILAGTSINRPAFVASFLALYVLGLAIEVWYVHKFPAT